MVSRNVYPNAPIALVSLEIGLEAENRLEPQVVNRLSGVLRDVLPERADLLGHNFSFNIADKADPIFEKVESPRWSSRDKRTHFTIHQNPIPPEGGMDTTLSFELTNYQGYAKLRDLVSDVINEVMPSAVVRKVKRVGLRYLDEIRVPSPPEGSPIEWSDWVKESLVHEIQEVSPFLLAGGVKQTSVAYQVGEDSMLHMRFGAAEGYEFTGSDQFRRELPTPGPYFLLDLAIDKGIDAKIDPDSLLRFIDEAHEPIREIFEAMITDKLRQEVLNNDH